MRPRFEARRFPARGVRYRLVAVQSPIISLDWSIKLDLDAINAEGRELWNRKARFWDGLFGDSGNAFHRRLVEPSILQLLELRRGEEVLDIGCGNGVMSRRLAQGGASVTAFDFSEEMIRLARGRRTSAESEIDYRVIDATDEAAMIQLGAGRFQAIICSMALMDIPLIDPLFRAASQLLRRDGRFVFATMHPAFNSNNPVFSHEKEDIDGDVREHYAVKLRYYLDLPPVKGSGAPGEPAPHYYFHRPLEELLGAAFAAGFVLDGLREPAFTAADAVESRPLGWNRYTQIPPVLTARLRLR